MQLKRLFFFVLAILVTGLLGVIVMRSLPETTGAHDKGIENGTNRANQSSTFFSKPGQRMRQPSGDRKPPEKAPAPSDPVNTVSISSTQSSLKIVVQSTGPVDEEVLKQQFLLNASSVTNETVRPRFQELKSATSKLIKGMPREVALAIVGAPAIVTTNSLYQEWIIFSPYPGRWQSLVGDEYPMLKMRVSDKGLLLDWWFDRKPLYLATPNGLKTIAQ